MDLELKKVYFGVFIAFLVIAVVGLFITISDLNGQYSVGGRGRRFFEDAASFKNPLTGNAAADSSEQKRAFGYEYAPTYRYDYADTPTQKYGYVDAPSYGKAQDVSTDSYDDSTKSEITQVYDVRGGQARIKPVLEQPVVPTLPSKIVYPPVYDESKLVIKDLEDLKKLICPGYNIEKPIQKIEPYYGEEKKEDQSVTYTYDEQGRLNTIEPMGRRGRRFVADAG